MVDTWDFYNQTKIQTLQHPTDPFLVCISTIAFDLALKREHATFTKNDPLYDIAHIIPVESDGKVSHYWVPMPFLNAFLFRIDHSIYSNKHQSELILRYQYDLSNFLSDVVEGCDLDILHTWQEIIIDWNAYYGIVRYAEEKRIDVPADKPKPQEVQNAVGYVYLLQCGDHYKIGKTKNIDDRIKQFAPKLPQEPLLIASRPSINYHTLETELHQKFADKRTNGEWFLLSPDDIYAAFGVKVS